VLSVCCPHIFLQAIAALNKALGADPTNLEVLLSLGVSHTNELDAGK
jgi:peroxin-5